MRKKFDGFVPFCLVFLRVIHTKRKNDRWVVFLWLTGWFHFLDPFEWVIRALFVWRQKVIFFIALVFSCSLLSFGDFIFFS